MLLDNPDALLLYLFRMERCEEFGLKREVVTYSDYELDVYTYCLHKLGSIFRSGRYAQIRVRMPDMNGQARPYAIVPKFAAEDFSIFCENLEGYTYPPYGPGASSFGWGSKETIAWIQPHRDVPALLFKPFSEDNVIAVSEFMGACTELDSVPPWPKRPTELTAITPTGKIGGRLAPGAMRKARSAKKALQRLHR